MSKMKTMSKDDDRARRMYEPLVFWRQLAVELVTNILDRRGFDAADRALSAALSQFTTGCAGDPETTSEYAAGKLIDEFEEMAHRQEVAKLLNGPPCRNEVRAPLPCSIEDFTGRCLWCDEPPPREETAKC
jgi:hypothetical protein